MKLIPSGRETLKPPERRSIFREFDTSQAHSWHEKNIQKCWWKQSNQTGVTILSEWCLLREIVWTLQLSPTDNDPSDTEPLERFSTIFSLDRTTDEIVINQNVSLENIPVESLQSMLSEFALVATKLYRFRVFFATVFYPPSVNSFLESIQAAPYSIQCYANGIKDFLRTISKVLCEFETELIKQDLTETYTVVYLYNHLLPHFRTIHTLYDIHSKVSIDFKTNAGEEFAQFSKWKMKLKTFFCLFDRSRLCCTFIRKFNQ